MPIGLCFTAPAMVAVHMLYILVVRHQAASLFGVESLYVLLYTYTSLLYTLLTQACSFIGQGATATASVKQF